MVEDRLAAQLPRRGGELIAEAEALAAAYPLRERPHALLIDALRLGGRNAEALTAYERIRRRLADELGTDPGLELRRAHLAALQADSGRPTGTVTAPLTSLIGREAEQSQIRARLDSGRLVTLVGPWGVGKTRLAIGVAAQPFEPGSSGRGHAVGLIAVDWVGTQDAIMQWIGNRQVLLLFDNFEHVMAAVQLISLN